MADLQQDDDADESSTMRRVLAYFIRSVACGTPEQVLHYMDTGFARTRQCYELGIVLSTGTLMLTKSYDYNFAQVLPELERQLAVAKTERKAIVIRALIWDWHREHQRRLQPLVS